LASGYIGNQVTKLMIQVCINYPWQWHQHRHWQLSNFYTLNIPCLLFLLSTFCELVMKNCLLFSLSLKFFSSVFARNLTKCTSKYECNDVTRKAVLLKWFVLP
jgi:hypothetical protein